MKSLLISTLVLMASAVPEFAQIAPPQAAGYKLVFSEDFSNFSLSPDGYGQYAWYPGLYYQPPDPLPGAISAGPAGLDLQWQRNNATNGQSIEGCAFDGSHCDTFRYGYFEARMKWDVTTGAWPVFWMVPKQGILGATDVGELDIFEGQGDDPNHYYGTVNEWDNYSLVSTNSNGHNRYLLPANNDFSQWHNYGVLWVPGRVTWYFDGQAVGTAPTPAILDQEDFFIILTSAEGNTWQSGNLTGVSAQSINLDVAWVHAFQSSAYPSHANVAAVPAKVVPPTILTTTLPAPNLSLPYAVELQVQGGTPPYKLAISSGALPGGLHFDSSSGLLTNITGAKLVSGPYSFTLHVTDAANQMATQTYSGSVANTPLEAKFTSYALPHSSGANGITVGSDGNLWFTTLDQTGGNLIGHITTAGVVTTTPAGSSLTPSKVNNFELPTGGDIIGGLDGKLWVAARDGGAIRQVATNLSTQNSYTPPTRSSQPAQIAAAADGSLWFTETAASKIGRVDATGAVTEFPTLTPSSYPAGIAIARNNRIVFTEQGANKIGYMTEDGTVNEEYPIPTPASLPTSIVLGPDNAFYFTEYGANKIGRRDVNGNFAEASVSSAPQAITLGADGALYFTETAANKIGRMTITGDLTELAIPDASSGPTGIVTGPDGAIWFTENNLSKIGRLSFVAGPTITCSVSQVLQVGSSLSGTCKAAQGTPPYLFGASGNPPPGGILNSTTGAISGTMTQAGTFTVTVFVHDSSSPAQFATENLTFTVTAPTTTKH